VDGTGSGLCTVAGFGNSGVEPSKYKIELNSFTIEYYVYLNIYVSLPVKLIPGSYCCVVNFISPSIQVVFSKKYSGIL
jgi:hypothetical protein